MNEKIEKFHLKGFVCFYLTYLEQYVLFYGGKLAEDTFQDINYNEHDYYGFKTQEEAVKRVVDFYKYPKKWRRIDG